MCVCRFLSSCQRSIEVFLRFAALAVTSSLLADVLSATDDDSEETEEGGSDGERERERLLLSLSPPRKYIQVDLLHLNNLSSYCISQHYIA